MSKFVTKTFPLQYFLYDWTVKGWGYSSSQGCSSFSLHFSTPSFLSAEVVVPECIYFEKLPVALGEGRSFCLTWTLKDSKRTFLALPKSPEGWLENYQIYKKKTSKMKTYNPMLQQLFHHQKLSVSHSVIHVFLLLKKKDF